MESSLFVVSLSAALELAASKFPSVVPFLILVVLCDPRGRRVRNAPPLPLRIRIRVHMCAVLTPRNAGTLSKRTSLLFSQVLEAEGGAILSEGSQIQCNKMEN